MAGGVADLLHVFCDASNWCFQTVIELSTALFYYTKREGINFVAVKYDEIIAGVYYLSISPCVCVWHNRGKKRVNLMRRCVCMCVCVVSVHLCIQQNTFLLTTTMMTWRMRMTHHPYSHVHKYLRTHTLTHIKHSRTRASTCGLLVWCIYWNCPRFLLHPTISLFRVNTTWLTGVTMWPSDAEPPSWLIQWEMLVLLYKAGWITPSNTIYEWI